VELKKLGATEVTLPEIGLGTWQYTGGTEPLRKGISLGAFHIDTAEIYGTEEVVGEAIKEQRARVFLATKVSGNNLKYDEVIRAAEGSLKRLRTDYIDLYQIHWPNPGVPIEETMRAIETLVDNGKVRFIGVSNFYVHDLEEAQASMRKYKIVSNQVKYSLLQRGIESDLLSYCQKNHITVIAYSPLAEGELTSKPLFKKRRAMAVLERIAKKTGKTMAQVALNWCLSKPNVISIPKSDNLDRVAENCGSSGWRLSSEQVEALDQVF